MKLLSWISLVASSVMAVIIVMALTQNTELKKDLAFEKDWSRDKINEISDMADSLWRENARLEDTNSKMRLVLDLAGYSPDSSFLSLLPRTVGMKVFSGTTGQVSSAAPLLPMTLPHLSSVPPIQLRHILCSLVLHTAFDVDWNEKPVVDLHFREGGLYRLWWSSANRETEIGSYWEKSLYPNDWLKPAGRRFGRNLVVRAKDSAGKLARWLR